MNRSVGFQEPQAHACPACGALSHRHQAHYCATCGRALRDGAYLPADALRASYHMQQHRPAVSSNAMNIKQRLRAFNVKLPTPNRNGASTTALAFVTYSLVPYLGILFCPGAVLMGGVGLIRSWRVPHVGGRKASVAGVAFGVMIFGIQIFLWWILYKVPGWTQGREF
ncbi:MAG TPA: hypothetical protein VGC91_14465 [Pyrinomonadaceae bacterium]